jgi:hypothetical protein
VVSSSGSSNPIVLAPTQTKKDEYNTKVLEAKAINKIIIK